MAGYDLPLRAIREQISSAIDLMIQVERMHDGSRRVVRITEVQRMESDVITLQDLFVFEVDAVAATAHRHVVGTLKGTGLRPHVHGEVRQARREAPGRDLTAARRAAGASHRGRRLAMSPMLTAAGHEPFWSSTLALALAVGACALVVGVAVALILFRRSGRGGVRERIGEFVSPHPRLTMRTPRPRGR